MNNPPAPEGPRTLVIGIGNPHRGDDAAGLAVARWLKARNPAGIRVIELSGEGAALLEAWKNAPAVIVLDAAHSGAVPGTVHRFDARAGPLPSRIFRCSTHAFSLVEAIELARALHKLPPQLTVYGIEGKNFAAGEKMSAEVEQGAAAVARRVIAETRPGPNAPRRGNLSGPANCGPTEWRAGATACRLPG